MSPELHQEIQGVALGARQGEFDPGDPWGLKPGYLWLNVIQILIIPSTFFSQYFLQAFMTNVYSITQ